MDFAPYQSEEPSASRTQLPGTGGVYTPPAVNSSASAPGAASTPPPPMYSPSLNAYGGPQSQSSYGGGPSSSAYGNQPEDPNGVPVNQYETSMPIRLDWESIIAYAALPPVGSAILLVFETKNDYVRFHAWQASLFFTPLFILYIILSFSTVLSYLVLAIYLIAAGYMAFRAFKDSATLERLELPVIGRLASDWVDSE
ncbi:hypothetical protein V1512DRAFT_260345 [Lipomyces arxii]|uniref:uncharacterized protein n=1 Tax=Lipomyces arxii TaxID=56418 RepID=UPI0034CE4F54